MDVVGHWQPCCPYQRCVGTFAAWSVKMSACGDWMIANESWTHEFMIHSQMLHVWYIYLHDWVIDGVNVGKYSIHGAYGIMYKIINMAGDNEYYDRYTWYLVIIITAWEFWYMMSLLYIYIVHYSTICVIWFMRVANKNRGKTGDVLKFESDEFNGRWWCYKRLLLWQKRRTTDILVGGLEHEFYFSICWECRNPNWRTHLFQRGRSTTNQHSLNMSSLQIWWADV